MNNISFRGWQPDDYAEATGKMPHDTFVGENREYFEELIDFHNKIMPKWDTYGSSKKIPESNIIKKLKNLFWILYALNENFINT